jgi:transcriptional regulator with XRE-family HTH domain
MTDKELVVLIRAERIAKQIRQVQVCKDLKICRSTLSRIETGDLKPNRVLLHRIAEYVGVDMKKGVL